MSIFISVHFIRIFTYIIWQVLQVLKIHIDENNRAIILKTWILKQRKNIQEYNFIALQFVKGNICYVWEKTPKLVNRQKSTFDIFIYKRKSVFLNKWYQTIFDFKLTTDTNTGDHSLFWYRYTFLQHKDIETNAFALVCPLSKVSTIDLHFSKIVYKMDNLEVNVELLTVMTELAIQSLPR